MFRKTWNVEKYPDNSKGKWDELVEQVSDVFVVQKHPFFKKDVSISKEENWIEVVKTCTPTHGSHQFSQWHLYSLRNMCDCLGKKGKDDVECRQNTASVVLTPRVSETVSPSRASAAHNFSDIAWIAGENLSARASTVESDWFADSARAAWENLWIIPNSETTEARANVTKDEEHVWMCTNCRSRRNPEDWATLSDSSGQLCTLLRWSWQKVELLRNMSRKQHWANQRQICSTRSKLGQWCESAKPLRCWFG